MLAHRANKIQFCLKYFKISVFSSQTGKGVTSRFPDSFKKKNALVGGRFLYELKISRANQNGLKRPLL